MKPSHLPVPIRRLRRGEINDLRVAPEGLARGSLHLFSGVSDSILKKLTDHSIIYRAQTNVALRMPDDFDDEPLNIPLWYILSGHVHVEREVSGKSVVIGSLGPGDLCGETELVLQTHSRFSIVTVSPLTYLEFDSPKLILELADEVLLRNLLKAFARKLKDRAERVSVRRSRDTTTIVRDYLVEYAREAGLEGNTNRVKGRASLTNLASRLGISRQSVRNAFNKIKEFSYVRSQVVIKDPALLRTLKAAK